MRVALVFAAVLLLSGCESMRYYAQAIGGQLEIMRAARPVTEWLKDPDTPPDLRSRAPRVPAAGARARRTTALSRSGKKAPQRAA